MFTLALEMRYSEDWAIPKNLKASLMSMKEITLAMLAPLPMIFAANVCIAQNTPLHPITGLPLVALPLSELANNDGTLACDQEFNLNGFAVPGNCSRLGYLLGQEELAHLSAVSDGAPPGTLPSGWRGGECLSFSLEFSSEGTYTQRTIERFAVGGDTSYEYTGTFNVDQSTIQLECEARVFYGNGRYESSCVGSTHLPNGFPTYGEYDGNKILIYNNPANPDERFNCSATPISLEAAVSAAISAIGQSNSTTSPTEDSNCDYSAAPFNNGWGWNQISGEACAPMQIRSDNDCDYTSAWLNDGWGWNPITSQSCPPF